MKVSTLAMESGDVFNLQDFEKKRSFSKKEALKIPLIHFLAYLTLICC